MRLPNPLIPGFNPDPSVVRVDGEDGPVYYLVTSTFEYVPGIPVYRSTDLVEWELIGHVITRTEQFDASRALTNMGIWAPTIRWHDGVFQVIVAAASMGTKVFTATDPAGTWSDGITLVGVDGIDPDLAWDADGTCYVTYSGLVLTGPDPGRHLGIQQVRVDLSTGEPLEQPRSMWSGTGLKFPEAPHLYEIDGTWYLMIAEGGTERGHSVSIARSDRPDGPFEGCPANPVLSARSTERPVQNTGHGDLVVAPDGTWSMVLLGMRVRGMTRSFSALGRETFGTHLEWVDGWPVVEPVELSDDLPAPIFVDGFDADQPGPEWIGVRRTPAAIGELSDGHLVLTGEGRSMSHAEPTFVGHRQRRLDARMTTWVSDPSTGVGGVALRYDEEHHCEVEIDAGRVTARVVLPTLCQEWNCDVPAGPVELIIETVPTGIGFDAGIETLASRMTSDRITLAVVDSSRTRHDVATVDGRYLTAESACSFTGRVVGPYCVSGRLAFEDYREEGLS